MTQPVLAHILHHRLDADLHRGAKGAVDARLQDQQVAHMNGRDEVQVVHAGGHRDGPGMSARRHRSNQVDVLHQPTAKQISQGICVGGKDNLAALGLRLAYRSCQNRFAHSYQCKSPLACQLHAGRRTIGHMDRIALLTQVLEQNPSDAFARYGLAMAHTL